MIAAVTTNATDIKAILVVLGIALIVDIVLIIRNAKEHGAEMLQQYRDDDDEYEDDDISFGDDDDPWEVWD